MPRKLEDGLRVHLWKLGDAGGYEIQKVRSFSTQIALSVSGGEPFECAREESEEMAITIDAEFEFGGEILRESLSGKYFETDSPDLLMDQTAGKEG